MYLARLLSISLLLITLSVTLDGSITEFPSPSYSSYSASSDYEAIEDYRKEFTNLTRSIVYPNGLVIYKNLVWKINGETYEVFE